jgi:hypothetical protein
MLYGDTALSLWVQWKVEECNTQCLAKSENLQGKFEVMHGYRTPPPNL